ncbi:hypothetical protein FACS189431_3660 [Alphaproteobacteria bacterium]|nr:hypothetical protein FACS189431_3660 [Alphaproteobacteria bacterium]
MFLLYTNYMKKVIVGSLLVAVVVAGIAAPLALAEGTPDEAKLNTIRTKCVAAQSTLQRVGRNDTTSRINRGRDYDAALKLFYAMNARVAASGQTVPRLTEITKSFETELASFRDKYNSYSGEIKTAVDTHCADQPAEFYRVLGQTRNARSGVNTAIIRLDGLIDDYKKVVTELAL